MTRRTMTTTMATLVAIGLGMLSPPPALHAQRMVSLGIAGGVSMPISESANGLETGWRALGTLALGAPMLPLGLRVDAAYDRFPIESGSISTNATGSSTVSSLTLNPTYRLPMAGSPISPYLIAGGGAYRLGCSGAVDCDAITRGGWNAGIGARFATLGARGFIEARYNRVEIITGSVQFVPITFGLLF